MPVSGLEHQRGHVDALAVLACYTQRANSRPGREWAGRRREASVAGHCTAGSRLFEQRLEDPARNKTVEPDFAPPRAGLEGLARDFVEPGGQAVSGLS